MTGSSSKSHMKKPKLYEDIPSYISTDSKGRMKVHPPERILNQNYSYELRMYEQQKNKGKSSHHGHTGGGSSGGRGKSCGDPGCGVTHWCQMHYSQAVQPMGYSGYARTPVYQSGGGYCQPRWC